MLPLCLLVAAHAAAPSVAADATGAWRLSQDEAAYARQVEAAIERSAADFSFAFRPFVRRTLAGLVVPCSDYRFAWTDAALTFECGDRGPRTVAVDGRPSAFQNDEGDAVTARYSFATDGFELTFQGDEGGQSTRFVFEGDHLVVHKRVFSPRLETPLVWTIDYAR